MATVGLRPGDPAAGFFPDWNLSILGQVARRFSIGAGDISIKRGRELGRTTADDPLLLVLFDLDGFKLYNDTFGHPAGDSLLVRLGAALTASSLNTGPAC